MTGFLPTSPKPLAENVNSIRAALAVRGDALWKPLALDADWLLGRGSSLIVGGLPDTLMSAAPGGTSSHSYFIYAKVQNPTVVVFVTLTADGGACSGTMGIFGIGGSSAVWRISADEAEARTPKTFQFEFIFPSPATADGGIRVDVTNDSHSVGTVYVLSITAYEVPRFSLPDFTGVTVPEAPTCATQMPIYKESTEDESAHSVCKAVAAAVFEARRSALFTWSSPNPTALTSGSFVNLFGTAGGASIIARHLHDGETQRTIWWAALVLVTGGGGTTGEVRATAHSGATQTLTVTASGSSSWEAGAILVNTEDLSRLDIDGGMRGGVSGLDYLTFEARVVDATSIKVYGIGAGEAP